MFGAHVSLTYYARPLICKWRFVINPASRYRLPLPRINAEKKTPAHHACIIHCWAHNLSLSLAYIYYIYRLGAVFYVSRELPYSLYRIAQQQQRRSHRIGTEATIAVWIIDESASRARIICTSPNAQQQQL